MRTISSLTFSHVVLAPNIGMLTGHGSAAKGCRYSTQWRQLVWHPNSAVHLHTADKLGSDRSK